MKRFVKHLFIPHEGNDHKPHFLRSKSALTVAGIVLLFEVLFLVQSFIVLPKTGLFALVLPDALINQTNKIRSEDGLVTLTINPLLTDAARAKANDMVENGYFAHTSPAGITPWYWFQKVGYTFQYAGENLAVNFLDSSDVTTAWLNSPLHRKNILDGRFTEIGIAAAQGTYKDKDNVVFVVEFFGTPAAQVAALPIETKREPLIIIEEEHVVVNIPATKPTQSEEVFLAVRGVEAEAAASPLVMGKEQNPLTPIVASAGGTARVTASLITSPKATVNLIFLIVSALVLLALILKVFIRAHIQHPQLIANGMLLLVFIGAILIINDYLTLTGTQII